MMWHYADKATENDAQVYEPEVQSLNGMDFLFNCTSSLAFEIDSHHELKNSTSHNLEHLSDGKFFN